ncbi:MAG: arginine--tRNA ligase [Candidatus Yanofskybacteria bacterium]|nr:arginine--tRNA ligase [Candidatus Yanofskybacteria bacterium]
MVRQEILRLVRKAAERAFPSFDPEKVSLEHPEDIAHGDYATGIALALASQTKENPGGLAQALAAELEKEQSPLIEKAEVAGPGFVNIFLNPEALYRILLDFSQGVYGQSKKQKRVIIEYSSPNIAKRFGIGHLRSTIIGDALYRMQEFLGYETIGINHLGDWGTPHGIVLYQVQKHFLTGKEEQEVDSILSQLTVGQLEDLYVRFNTEAESNPELKEQAKAWFKKLEQGDKRARHIWEYARKVSSQEFERIYARLGVHIEHVLGESFYEDKMKDVVEKFKKKGLARKSEGALIVEFEHMPPAMLLKSDGTTTYFTRDLAAMNYRINTWKPHKLIIETGMEQNLHFRQVFEASRQIGWAENVELAHVGHGMYRLAEGKFSTRKGRTIHLEEVLNEAEERARLLVATSESEAEFTEQEQKEIAAMVGVGGVKYNDLMHNPQGDVLFDWDRVLNLKGNSGPYIQYAYARSRSILRQAELKEGSLPEASLKLAPGKVSPEEERILRLLYRFPEVVQDAVDSYAPNMLCEFLFDLAQKYNVFYNTHRVLEAATKEQKEFRLFMTASVARVLKDGLALLGIQSPERM